MSSSDEWYETTCDAPVPGSDNDPGYEGNAYEKHWNRCGLTATGYSNVGDGYLAHSYPWPACTQHSTEVKL